jgi:hypothetical protein
MKAKLIITLALLFLATVTFAQKKDYSKYKGYVDFGNLEKFETDEEVVEVVIEEHLLRMVAKMATRDEPELGNMLSGIKLIKVHTFGVSDANFSELKSVVKNLNKTLMNKGWDRIVKTRSKDEVVSVFILTTNEEKIEGLVVTSVEKDGDAAFVNIVGDIDLETIGQLSEKFDIPTIGDLSNQDAYDSDSIEKISTIETKENDDNK